MRMFLVVGLLLGPMSGHSESTVSATRVVALLPRSNGLYFNIDRSVTEGTCTNNTLVVRVDSGISELAYKTLVQSISLAYAMDKSVHVYLDGCVGTYPRAIGLDIY
jgi:hypothetical protein